MLKFGVWFTLNTVRNMQDDAPAENIVATFNMAIENTGASKQPDTFAAHISQKVFGRIVDYICLGGAVVSLTTRGPSILIVMGLMGFL